MTKLTINNLTFEIYWVHPISLNEGNVSITTLLHTRAQLSYM